MRFYPFVVAVLSLLLLPACSPAQQTEMQRAYATAQKALAAGDTDGALKIFERLSRANPDIAEIHATIGVIYFQQGNYPEALKQLNEAKRLKPALPKLDGLIAMSQSELGDYKQALPNLEETFRAT